MKKPDLPLEEERRLQTLRSLEILDTAPEERFDRLTRMAKRMFDVPIALVSLVDENRQWFKSCIGLPVRETPRDISFCGHAILDDQIFIIPDALEDERFSDNPLVTDEPYIRFYAGCPLRYLDGSHLGTLCIIDRKPRTLSAVELEGLKDLALTAERELAAIQLATLDDLTNINNRRGFMLLAQHSLNLFCRENIPASLVFIDLNRFKPINDQFGHAEGDRALKAFADQIKLACRESDLFARLGGDEFVALLTNTDKTAAEEVVSRLRKNVDRYNQKEHRGYDIEFSYGIVEYNRTEHKDLDELLSAGDSLMYERKKSGPH